MRTLESLIHRLGPIAWPAFIGACLVEGAVFALFDPHDSQFARSHPNMIPGLVYGASFFIFWGCTLVACAFTRKLVETQSTGQRRH